MLAFFYYWFWLSNNHTTNLRYTCYLLLKQRSSTSAQCSTFWCFYPRNFNVTVTNPHLLPQKTSLAFFFFNNNIYHRVRLAYLTCWRANRLRRTWKERSETKRCWSVKSQICLTKGKKKDVWLYTERAVNWGDLTVLLDHKTQEKMKISFRKLMKAHSTM